MSYPPAAAREPLHLLGLRALVYAGAALLFVTPLATWAGVAAAVAAVPLGLLLARRLAVSPVRLPVLALGCLGLGLVGLSGPALLGGPAWVARLLGVPATLALIEVFLFGLTTFALVAGLRVLTARVPALGVLETGCVVAAVVWVFAGHRDYQIGRPRLLSDWALSRGHDPLLVLLAIGMVAGGAVALLLLERQRVAKTLATVAALLLLCAVAFWILTWRRPDLEPQRGGGAGGGGQAQGREGGGGRDQEEHGFTPPQNEKPQPKLLVLLHDDFTPVQWGFYFRNVAYSQYNGKRLVRATFREADRDLPERLPTRREEFVERTARPLAGKPVPTTVYLLDDHLHPPALVNATVLEPKPNPKPQVFRAAYAVTSRVQDVGFGALRGAAAGDPLWSEALRRHYLSGPEDPRYRELAEQITNTLEPAQRGLPVLRALATKRWIEKNVIYSKRPSPAGSADPTTAFLFGDRRGYCVHIAHAMAYLLRAQGIPARVAAGYAADRSRRGSGSSILVQSTDGHAWCEMYVQGEGWVVVDSSPERSEDPPPPSPSAELQRQMGEMARREQGRQREEAQQNGGQDAQGTAWPAWLLWPLGLVGLLYLIKVWRRLAPQFAPAGQLYRVCYRMVLDQLAEVGLWRRFGETREEFARRVEPLAAGFGELSAAHVRRAVAGCETYPVGEWRARADGVVRTVLERTPVRRQVLGLLNPVAWLWAR